MKIVLRKTFFLTCVIVVCIWLVIKLSLDALPGDNLYPVKLCWETVQLTAALDSGYRKTLSIRQSAERKIELKTLIEEGKAVRLFYSGIVQEVNGSDIVVDGIRCKLITNTIIQGKDSMGVGTLADMQLITQTAGDLGKPRPPLVISIYFHRRLHDG